jgi:integrase
VVSEETETANPLCKPRVPLPLLEQAKEEEMRGEGRIYRREGSRYWWIAYYHNGKQKREPALYCRGKKNGQKIEAAEENREAAEKFLKDRINEITAEKYGGPAFVGPEQRRMTVSQLLDALEADCKLRGVDSPQWKSQLKQARAYFGDWRAVDLTTERVDRYIQEKLEDRVHPATVNRNTQMLAQAYKLAIERKHLATAPLIRHLSEAGNARKGFFSETEFRTVASNLPPELADFALFGYLTGWRKGEIRSLRWQDVEDDVVRLRSENSKNGEARCVTLCGELVDLIERRKRARQVKTKSGAFVADLVFHHKGEPILDFRKAWATATKLAGVSGKLFHDLRRTAVRNMIRAGVPERVAMQISGHKTRSMLDRYNIVSEKDLRDALEKTQVYLTAAGEEERKRQPLEIRRVQ